ncbi:hypothetical protein QE414_000086 [Microbacterium sp. SORGH_AS 344]|nr:hypothetical protein [Microbacterium sp. SORGH_AS_0344]
MRLQRPLALLVAATLTTGVLTTSAAPAVAAVPSPILSYDFSASAAVGAGVAAGSTVSDGAGAHAGTVRGTGATVVAGPRGGGDKALRLPGGAAGSNAAFVEIAPGLTTNATTDVTMSAWMRWEGNQSCAWAYTLGQSSDRYLFTTPGMRRAADRSRQGRQRAARLRRRPRGGRPVVARRRRPAQRRQRLDVRRRRTGPDHPDRRDRRRDRGHLDVLGSARQVVLRPRPVLHRRAR